MKITIEVDPVELSELPQGNSITAQIIHRVERKLPYEARRLEQARLQLDREERQLSDWAHIVRNWRD